MPALTIKNIPPELYQELKHFAGLHRRSINSEVIVCLEKMLMPKKITPELRIKNAQLLRSQVKSDVINPEEIERAIHEGRP